MSNNNILERRIRPIFDCLDVGSYKKAAQEADKVLKKSPNLQCARALKALALLRMGREDEFEQMFSVLQKESISDDATLQVMKFVYRETEQPLAICKMYEDAVKLDPSNEEVASHLFMSYVQVNNFKGQQNVGMQLYKMNPKSPYYFWAVMSIVLQAKRGADSADEGKRKLLFTLAQRMLDKFIVDGKMEAEQEVQLYLSILQEQGKFQEALQFLEGPIGSKLYPGAPIADKLVLLRNLGQWTEVNKIIRKLVEAESDRWDYYQDYLQSSMELIKGNDPDMSFETCHEFICHLIERSPKKVRGPYLARLELHRLMRQEKADAVALLGEYSQLLLEYFRNFGDRNCCPHDLKVFARHLSAEEYQAFPQQLMAMAPLSDDGTCSTETMMKYICVVQVSRFWDTTDRSKEALESLAAKMIHLYGEYNKRFEGKLLTTDISPCDQFIVLAAQILCDLAVLTANTNYLMRAAALLTHLHEVSPSNFKAMLMLVKIFHWLGYISTASQVFDTIQPKYIQYDSLGYLHTGLCAPFTGSQTTVKMWYGMTTRFFMSSAKESVEYLAMSYRTGTFSKLQELLDFRDRLMNSLQNHQILVNGAILEIMLISGSAHSPNFAGIQQLRNLNVNPEHRIDAAALADNRDLEVIIRWDPVVVNDFDSAETRERKRIEGLEFVREQSFKEQVLLLRIRKTLLNIIVAQVNGLTGQLHHGKQFVGDLTSGDTKETTNDFVAVLEALRAEWSELFRSVPDLLATHYPETYLVNTLLSQLYFVYQSPCKAVIDHMSAFSLALIAGKSEGAQITELGESVVASLTEMMIFVRLRIQTIEPSLTYRMRLEVVGSVVELLSLITVVVAVLEKRSPAKSKNVGAKKTSQPKTTGTSPEWERSKQLAISNVTKELKEQLLVMDTALEFWADLGECAGEDLTTRIETLSLGSGPVATAMEEQESVLRGKLKASHLWAMADLRAIVKEKLKFISKA